MPLISLLQKITQDYPLKEKVLIVSNFHTGHQILQNLSREGCSWVNWQVATGISLAHDIIEDIVIEKELRVISKVASNALIDDIFCRLAEKNSFDYFKKHAVNKGIVNAITEAISDLRMHGVTGNNLSSEAFISKEKYRDIKSILLEYEQVLSDKKFIDTPETLNLAYERLKDKNYSPDKVYVIVSNCYSQGIERKFLEKLCGDSLIIVSGAQAIGMNVPKYAWIPKETIQPLPPDTDSRRLQWLFKSRQAPPCFKDDTIKLFRAYGHRNEVREVFRRIISENLPVDEVEIVYTNERYYIPQIYYLTEKLGIKTTYFEGIHAKFHGPAAMLNGFLLWIKSNYRDIYLSRMIESGFLDMAATDETLSTALLSHLLKTSCIGWGRERYEESLSKRIEEVKERIDEAGKEDETDQLTSLENNITHLKAIKKFSGQMISFVPEIDAKGKVGFDTLCEGCIKFIETCVRKKDRVDAVFGRSLKQQFSLLSELYSQKIDFKEAIEKLISFVGNLKISAGNSKQGHIHVCNYRNAAQSRRKHTFVIGLDESCFPPKGLQDPILLDEERKVLGEGFEISNEKIAQSVYEMAVFLANNNGTVTASFSAYDVKEERNSFPSIIMLQFMRVKQGDSQIDYSQLSDLIGIPVGYKGQEKTKDIFLDDTDWWINRIASTQHLKDGLDSAFSIYPGIKQGVFAQEQRESEALTVYDGMVQPQGMDLDLRKNKTKAISVTRLEAGAKCPYKYFLSSVLGIRKPEEVEKDLTVWLTAMERGSLLHEVYQEFFEKNKDTQQDEKEQAELSSTLLETAIERYKKVVPVPNQIIFENECRQLRRDMEIFLQVNGLLKTKQVYAELSFGMEGKPAIEIKVGKSASIFLKGRIDRVDKDENNNYSVWDYKTGSTYCYRQNDYSHMGEQLQHSLYGLAIEEILKAKGKNNPKILKSGYLFPTEKGAGYGGGMVFARNPQKYELWQEPLNILFNLISRGKFLIPNNAPCGFCDYEPVCNLQKQPEGFKNKSKKSEEILLWETLKKCR